MRLQTTVYVCQHEFDITPICNIQLAEPPPEVGTVSADMGEGGDLKAANTTGYSNIEAIEMTASGAMVF